MQAQPAIEMGTQNSRLHVDYDWLPKEVLQELSKFAALMYTPHLKKTALKVDDSSIKS